MCAQACLQTGIDHVLFSLELEMSVVGIPHIFKLALFPVGSLCPSVNLWLTSVFSDVIFFWRRGILGTTSRLQRFHRFHGHGHPDYIHFSLVMAVHGHPWPSAWQTTGYEYRHADSHGAYGAHGAHRAPERGAHEAGNPRKLKTSSFFQR